MIFTIDINKILTACIRAAKKSPCKYKVSCVLVDNRGRIVATGFNFTSTNSKRYGTFSIHAEMQALSKVRKPSTNLTAFIYRKNGRMITPCHSCAVILKAYGITTVWHTAGNSEFIKTL